MQQTPPAPPDSLLATYNTHYEQNAERRTQNEVGMSGDTFFVEKIAQVEMKIYPNPATEKVTLEISNMDDLQTGILQLLSLSGQLLQTQTISTSSAEVSLSGFAQGTYILKVQINGITEDWKIIKQ
jgi:hypothetical protein